MVWLEPLRHIGRNDISAAGAHLFLTVWSFAMELFMRDGYVLGEFGRIPFPAFLVGLALLKIWFFGVLLWRMASFARIDAFLTSVALQVAIMCLCAAPIRDTTFWPAALFSLTISLTVFMRAVIVQRLK